MGKKRRVSISLSDEEFDQLDFIAERFGFSRAAVVTGMISESLPVVYAMTEASVKRRKKEKPETTIKRVRGVSADLLAEQIKTVMKQ